MFTTIILGLIGVTIMVIYGIVVIQKQEKEIKKYEKTRNPEY